MDKQKPCNAILRYIRKINPSILVLQEFEVNNSVEPEQFAKQLSKDSYEMISNMPEHKASITAVFVKSDIKSKCELWKILTFCPDAPALFEWKILLFMGLTFPERENPEYQSFGMKSRHSIKIMQMRKRY